MKIMKYIEKIYQNPSSGILILKWEGLLSSFLAKQIG